MMRKIIVLISLSALVLLLLGCGIREEISNKIKKEKEKLSEMEKAGGKVCAPKEYAAAEAHLEFAEHEWNERDYREAGDHITLAKNSMKKAQPFLGSCRETTPTDRDKDGIPDVFDRCPDTPGLAQYFGCPPPDRDGDGIPDNEDLCPDVPGVKEEKGCPPKPKYKTIEVTDKAINLKQMIHFEFKKDTILPDSYPILDEIAQVLLTNKTWVVRIEGHTDNIGGAKFNQTLSEKRAAACRSYLLSKGANSSNLISSGFGSTKPIATNNTEDGRAKNRRVEFHIVSK